LDSRFFTLRPTHQRGWDVELDCAVGAVRVSAVEIGHVDAPSAGSLPLVHPAAHRALCLEGLVHVRSVALRLAAEVDVAAGFGPRMNLTARASQSWGSGTPQAARRLDASSVLGAAGAYARVGLGLAKTCSGAVGGPLQLPEFALTDRSPCVQPCPIKLEPLAAIPRLLVQPLSLVRSSRAGSRRSNRLR
jgi:hypothetical protein